MKYLLLSGFLALSLLNACGSGIPLIESPADGAKFNIDSTASIDVTLVNQDYANTQIMFRGIEAVPDFQWNPSAGAPARAYKVPNGAGGFSQCTAQKPCTVFVIAIRGDQKDFRTIQLFR